MSIVDNLNNLQTNIENAKSILVNNLTEKGVTSATTSSTLTVLATSVADIPNSGGGGNPFEEIGYTSTPKYIQDGIDYSKEIYDNWDASVTNRSGAFSGDTELVYCPKVDTSNVTRMDYMFSGCTNLEYVPELDMTNVTKINGMFGRCTNLKGFNFKNLDTSKITSISKLFENSKFDVVDFSDWDTTTFKSTYYAFASCSGNTINLSNWVLKGGNSSDGIGHMFDYCKVKEIILNNVNTSAVTDMTSMFYQCTNLTSLDVSSFDTSNVTSMYQMFYQCSGLTSLDLSMFDTSNVTNMGQMFYYCNGLTSLDVSHFNTSKVTSMYNMFYNCSGLTSLDISSFDTSNVTNMNQMFRYCNNLTEIYWKNFGNGSGYTSVDFGSSSKLGVNTTDYPNAKQSLIDTLITYSFDRATAGYSTCTVKLSSTTKALLTQDEIAAITAKGFTIA